jgi:sulfatase maturation enzyme AslB (radical SAM superfamily)
VIEVDRVEESVYTCKYYIMSSVEQDEACASCGNAAVDDVKLKICTACKLVKYCSVDCQKNHRSQHKRACKKQMAVIRVDKLFIYAARRELSWRVSNLLFTAAT